MTIAPNCQSCTPQVAHVQAGRIAMLEVGISEPSIVIRTRTCRADLQVRPSCPAFPSTLSRLTSCSLLLPYSVASFLYYRPLAFTQFLLSGLHRYLHRRTQNNLRVGAKVAVCIGRSSGMSFRGGPRVSACQGDPGAMRHICQSLTVKSEPRGPFRRMPSNSACCSTSIGLTGH